MRNKTLYSVNDKVSRYYLHFRVIFHDCIFLTCNTVFLQIVSALEQFPPLNSFRTFVYCNQRSQYINLNCHLLDVIVQESFWEYYFEPGKFFNPPLHLVSVGKNRYLNEVHFIYFVVGLYLNRNKSHQIERAVLRLNIIQILNCKFSFGSTQKYCWNLDILVLAKILL